MLSSVIIQVRTELNEGKRVRAWDTLSGYIPEGSPVGRLLRKHVRDLRALDAFKKRLDPGPAVVYGGVPQKALYVPPRALRTRICKLCKTPTSTHRDKKVLKEHCFRMVQKHKANLSWKDYTPEKKRERMMKAWAGRRKKKDETVVSSVHPRLARLFGRGIILERMGRA